MKPVHTKLETRFIAALELRKLQSGEHYCVLVSKESLNLDTDERTAL